ncbi:MAG: cytochrome c biogenesis protein ResB [Propionibacteriales bacterium]|nr:cytochrome c biogenesis protein ResB [Propionibacteriales bacterium]
MTDTRNRPGRTTKRAPALNTVEFLRWAWRQLTSMRIALVLLFLLAVAAIPGSLIPQSTVDPAAVFSFRENNPDLARWYDRLGMFDVFRSVWFGAIYLMLMVSLVGCIVPRTRLYWRSFRAKPPDAPSRLSRLPAHHRWVDSDDAETVAGRVEQALRDRRYRVRRYVDGSGRQVVAAENGQLREAGNLVFHLGIVVVLLAVAYGALFGFKGAALVVEKEGFSNTLTQYDEFTPGAWFDTTDLDPFTLTVRDFDVTFETAGEQRGAPRSFRADLGYVEQPGAKPAPYDLQVNHPLRVGSTSVFLVGHGYAPRVTVRDGDGDVAFRGPVPFLPQDGSYTSIGVVKVPDAQPEQLGFEGFFLPTQAFDETRGPYSAFPDALNPALVLTAYSGDLQMNTDEPQSVYVIEKDKLTQFKNDKGDPFRLLLRPGDTVKLPDGAGSFTFDGVSRAVRLQIGSSPGKLLALLAVIAATLGLIASLFIRPRRAWVRVDGSGGDTVVEVAGLDRVAGGNLVEAVEEIATATRRGPQEEAT